MPMTLNDFGNQLRHDIACFEESYQAGIDGPDHCDEEMDAADWHGQFAAWLSLRDLVSSWRTD